jgi:hypothetical protein
MTNKESLENHAFLCVSASDKWHGPWKGRHQLMSRLSENNKVLFIEEPTHSILSVFRNRSRIYRLWSWLFVRKESKNLYLYSPILCLPFGNKNKVINKLNNFLMYLNLQIVMKILCFNPTVLYLCAIPWGTLAGLFKKTLSVYNAHDVWEVYPDSEKYRKLNLCFESETIKNVDLALFTAKQNMLRKQHLNPNSHYLPQGCPEPPRQLLNGSLPDRPLDLPDGQKPIIGYWGTIDKGSVDIQLVDDLSEMRKDWMFVFIGPVHKYDESAFAKLKQKENILFLGRKPLEQRYNYLCHFDVGVLCAQMIEMELMGSQLKIWEYISAGIPVVSIPIEEYKEFDELVLPAGNKNEWVANIEKALRKKSKEDVEKRLAFAKNNSWDNRVSALVALIKQTQRGMMTVR